MSGGSGGSSGKTTTGVVGGGPGDESGASDLGGTHGDAVVEAVDRASTDIDLAFAFSFALSLSFSLARDAAVFLSARRTIADLRTEGSSDSVAGVDGRASFSLSLAAFDLDLGFAFDLTAPKSFSLSGVSSSDSSFAFSFSLPLPARAFALLTGFAGAGADSADGGGCGDCVGLFRFFDSAFGVDVDGVGGTPGDPGRAEADAREGVCAGRGTTGESRDNLENGTDGDTMLSAAVARCFELECEEEAEEVEEDEEAAEIRGGWSKVVESIGGVREGGTGGGGMSRESAAQ